MKRSRLIVTVIALISTSATSAELAYTVRPTEMKAKPFTDATVVTSLPEASKVDVVQRQASWMQVKADKNTGWVKMLSLRFEAMNTTPAKNAAVSNLTAAYQIYSTGVGGSTPTTGVKGISEEALKNPHANPAAFNDMVALQVSPNDVQTFAHAAKLSSKTMDYLPAPASTSPAAPEGAKK